MFNNGFVLTNFINGISKTLGTINDLIPIYKETKPMIDNARNALDTIKKWSNNTSHKIINNNNVLELRKKVELIKTNNPTFFQ